MTTTVRSMEFWFENSVSKCNNDFLIIVKDTTAIRYSINQLPLRSFLTNPADTLRQYGNLPL